MVRGSQIATEGLRFSALVAKVLPAAPLAIDVQFNSIQLQDPPYTYGTHSQPCLPGMPIFPAVFRNRKL
jgi:hypothetical protein